MRSIDYRKPAVLYGLAGGIVLLLLILPLRTTLRKAGELVQLQSAAGRKSMTVRVKPDALAYSLLDQAEDHEKKIFEAISSASQHFDVTVAQLDPPQSLSTQNVVVLQQQATLEGAFVNILKCLGEANSRLRYEKIVSIRFDREERAKKMVLKAKVVFQSVKTFTNNE